ncbi:hypothetical protein pdam_00020284 [Pocillopora damicornis]|uniref:Uncharacterized protein n=1 Tax=Pocillopora damicornis TaxID=46731 RepID=A0A3M6UFQ1_POCDA|nr:hypothetical protein pdam_00020284 [Pocillopora damicornis]
MQPLNTKLAVYVVHYKCAWMGTQCSKSHWLLSEKAASPKQQRPDPWIQNPTSLLLERYHIRKFKRYIDDHRVSVPKSTKLDRSNTAISMTQSVVSTKLKAVVPTEESASHKGETFVQETEATICDYRGALELWSTNGYALSEGTVTTSVLFACQMFVKCADDPQMTFRRNFTNLKLKDKTFQRYYLHSPNQVSIEIQLLIRSEISIKDFRY